MTGGKDAPNHFPGDSRAAIRSNIQHRQRIHDLHRFQAHGDDSEEELQRVLGVFTFR